MPTPRRKPAAAREGAPGELPPEQQVQNEILREQCRTDLAHFARHFFPEYCRIAEFSPLHYALFGRRLEKTTTPLPDRRGELDVVLAPRGAAKSTLVSLIFPAHGLLYDLERYIVLISATQRQAALRLGALRAALVNNQRLRAVYPDRLDGRPARANARSLELAGVRVDAFSAMTELRGISHGPWRPTWIVLDDTERSDRVRSARHRDELADWFAEVVDNLGDTFTNVDLVGTLLHRDALPARLKKRPATSFSSYCSIRHEAEADALWAQWRAIFNDLSNPHRTRAAFEFYREHAGEMERGAEVLWPQKESYYDLQVLRETCGREAFDREKQNAPWAAGSAHFAAIGLRRFRITGERLVCDPHFDVPGAITPREGGPPELPLAELTLYGFLDPALGGPRGDYAAIATVGRDPAGYVYLLEVWMGRAGPTEQIRRIYDLHERWGYEQFGVESNNFQKLLMEPIDNERTRRRNAGRPWQCPMIAVHHDADKHTRIMALEPVLSNGWLSLNAGLSEEFMNQLLDYPNARHDDGPDAAAAAVKLARAAGERSALRLKTAPRRANSKYDI